MEDFRGAFSRLSRYEKVSAVVLVFFAVAAVFLGIAQTRARILNAGQKRTQPIHVGTTAPTVDPRKEDTDKDGVSDYDEITKYKTSPYLADSDSDGVSDAQEIANDTNPNCPEGQVCLGIGAVAGAYAQEDVPTPPATSDTAPSAPVSTPAPVAFDPKIVRETLKNAGVSEDVLDHVDDATLKKLYEETIKEQGTVPAGTVTQSAPTSQTEYLNQLRNVLIDSGVPKETVDKMSETELLQFIDSANKELQKTP